MNISAPNRMWTSLVLIALAALIAYSNTFDAPFIFDDHLQIVENHKIQNIGSFFSMDRLTAQRPFTDLTFAVNYYFHGLDVEGYHAVNLFIHILSGFAVFFLSLLLFRHLLKNSRHQEGSAFSEAECMIMALLTALIFVLHPLQTQAVTYIVQRYTSMAALFYLLAVLLYILARKIQLRGASFFSYSPLFLVCLLAGVLAFLSKQTAASLPGVLIAVEIILFGSKQQSWKKKLLWIVPVSGLFLVFVLYSTGLFSGRTDFASLLEDVSSLMMETETVSRLEYLFTQFTVIPLYIKLYLFPAGLNADHMMPFASGFFDGFTPWGFLILMLLLLAGLVTRKKTPIVLFAVLWFFITLSVESSIIPIRDALFEHRMYLPMLAPAMLTAWALVGLKKRWPIPAVCLMILLMVSLGILTYERNKVWGDEQLFWEDVLKGNPRNHRALTNLGLVLERKGNRQQAMTNYNRALMIDPEFPYALLNLGGLLGAQGNLKEAETVLKRGLEVRPKSARINNNLGVVLASQGKLEQSLKHFRKALDSNRFFLEASNNLALSYYNLDRKKDALKQFQRSLEINPADSFASDWLKRLEK